MKNAQNLIDDPIVNGTIVMPKGRAKSAMAGAIAGGVAGSAAKVAAQMGAESAGAGASPLPNDSWGIGYLALTDREIVVLKGKKGLVGVKATEVIARVARDAVRSAEVGNGKLTMPLTVAFGDGSIWEFEIGRANAKEARVVAEELSR